MERWDEQALVDGHRDVPLEVLRDSTRGMAERTSLRCVAEDAGVGTSTVHTFISSRTIPHPRVRRLLALWYLRRREGTSEIDLLRPYLAGLGVLLADAPTEVLLSQATAQEKLERLRGQLDRLDLPAAA